MFLIQTNLKAKLLLFYKLCRLDKPIGYLLVFFPAAYGILLANPTKPYSLLVVFFIASIIIRSAGCIINDFIDKDFDSKVARTRERPLATKTLGNIEVTLLLIFLLIISLIILLCLTRTAIYIGFIAFILICIYPFMKRITYFPQLFLGITFNIGTLIGYATIKDTVDLKALLLFIASTFWIIGYDTIYGFMDLLDDKKINVKSLSIFIENKNYQQYLFLCYSIFMILFTMVSIIYLPSNNILRINYLILAYCLLTLQIYNLNIKSAENCLYYFKLNAAVGILLFLYLLNI